MDDVLETVQVFQTKLLKYSSRDDEGKCLFYLSRLKKLPITVNHLEVTGVGKTVNNLRHKDGEIGEKARTLVGIWKKMVTEEEDSRAEARGDHRRYSSSTSYSQPAAVAQVPSHPNELSPEQCEEDEERLQIEETEEGPTNGASDDDYRPCIQEEYDPTVGNISSTPTLSSSSLKYQLPVSCSDDDNEKYDPLTSKLDYVTMGSNNLSYEPTAIATSPKSESGKESVEEIDQVETEVSKSQKHHEHSNSKSKSRHRDKSKSKKHKSHSKEKESSSSREKHKSSSKSKEKEKSRKDKKKDKERSHNKKEHSRDSKKKSTTDESLDRRLDSDINNKDRIESNSDNTPKIVNGFNSVSEDISSSNVPSKSHHSSSSKEKVKEDKHKKKKKTDDHSVSEHKSKKRKLEDSSEGFSAALMGLDEHSKKKKSKSRHKDEKKNKSKSNDSDVKDEKAKEFPLIAKNDNFSVRADVEERPSTSRDVFSNDSAIPDMPAALLDPNYKPLPRVLQADLLTPYESIPYQPSAPDPLLMTQEETLERMLSFKGRKSRQIYSGKTTYSSEVPPLMQLCIRVLQQNINSMECIGGVPYDILKPILEKATPEQLFNLENFNPYLLEDTNVLWEQHCKKKFKACQPEEMETFRDLYIRLTDERRQKLKNVTQSLQNKFVTQPDNRKKTVLAYIDQVAKPPKSVLRAQAKYGTGAPVGAPAKTTKAAELIARKNAMNNIQRVERAANNNNSSRTTAAKKTKAPLMAKTMQFYKKTFRR